MKAEAFIGSIPELYDRYLGPLIFAPYAEDLSRRVVAPAGGAVLEIAAGTGLVTRQIRSVLDTNVRIIATDLNDDMLNVARDSLDGRDNLSFHTADASNLAFEPNTFDSVVCQFGLMFFPDKPKSVREVKRVLKPGGRYLFNVWDSVAENDLVRTIDRTVRTHFPDDPPPFYDVPYGYYDIDSIRTMLDDAGFVDINVEVVTRPSVAESARRVAEGYILGSPMCGQIEARNSDVLADVVNSATDAIASAFGDPPIGAKMQALVFSAHCPSE